MPLLIDLTGKFVVGAKDLRASKLSYAQQPIKHAEFEKYTSKKHNSYGEEMRGQFFQARKSDEEKYLPRVEQNFQSG